VIAVAINPKCLRHFIVMLSVSGAQLCGLLRYPGRPTNENRLSRSDDRGFKQRGDEEVDCSHPDLREPNLIPPDQNSSESSNGSHSPVFDTIARGWDHPSIPISLTTCRRRAAPSKQIPSGQWTDLPESCPISVPGHPVLSICTNFSPRSRDHKGDIP
jgi:hypothetical protein